jgi:hypothetical protein
MAAREGGRRDHRRRDNERPGEDQRPERLLRPPHRQCGTDDRPDDHQADADDGERNVTGAHVGDEQRGSGGRDHPGRAEGEASGARRA